METRELRGSEIEPGDLVVLNVVNANVWAEADGGDRRRLTGAIRTVLVTHTGRTSLGDFTIFGVTQTGVSCYFYLGYHETLAVSTSD